jgi:hypothetical protein
LAASAAEVASVAIMAIVAICIITIIIAWYMHGICMALHRGHLHHPHHH